MNSDKCSHIHPCTDSSVTEVQTLLCVDDMAHITDTETDRTRGNIVHPTNIMLFRRGDCLHKHKTEQN